MRSTLAHGKDVPSPTAPADYLQSYLRSLDLSRRYSTEDNIKGKMSLNEEGPVIYESVVTSGFAMATTTGEQGHLIHGWGILHDGWNSGSRHGSEEAL